MSNELYHHGIKGQRWGVRRYQNEDGSYTRAGRKRYGLDLDISDTSRTNIARIRLGEARRRLDVSKASDRMNTKKLSELKDRERKAKLALKEAKRIDLGERRIKKKQSVTKNDFKQLAAHGIAYAGSRAMNSYLNTRLADLGNHGRLTSNHVAVAGLINAATGYALKGVADVYSAKKNSESDDIRRYQNAQNMGYIGKRSLGSYEYSYRLRKARKEKRKRRPRLIDE
jgi:hypothetical protein